MCWVSRWPWSGSPLDWWTAPCRHRTRRDRSTPRPQPPGRFSTWHPPRDGVRLQYKTEAPARGCLPPIPHQRSGQARRPAAPLEADLAPRELTHRHTGTLEPGARLRIAGDHEHVARRDRQHVAPQGCELGLRHLDERNAAGGQRLAKRYRQERRVNEEQVAVDRAHHRHEVEDVLRTAPVGEGHYDHFVHDVPAESAQLLDSGLVGPVATTHGQRAPVDPADVAPLHRPGSGDAAANRDARAAEGGLHGGGLGAPLRLAHVAEDHPTIADDGNVPRVERVEAYRVVA